MRMLKALRPLVPLAAGLTVAAMVAGPAGANHAWGSYHWARTSNEFTLQVGDNVNATWDAHLEAANSDWSQSSVLNLTGVSGTTTPKKCSLTVGRVEVCNAAYGNRGWLGIATISVSGSHIRAGTVKVNDTYHGSPPYNTPEWRRFVMCQEIGHTLGLGHQDENFNNGNLGTCMDYTNNPTSNQHPNSHDYAQLESIYNQHLDSSTTLAASSTGQQAADAGAGNSQAEWGQAIRYSSDGRPIVFEREVGNDQRIFTFVIWAEGSHRPSHHD